MKIEKDKNYIVSLKTIEEYEEFLKIAPWHDNSGTENWREYQDDNSFAVKVENGEIQNFDSLDFYRNTINYKDHIFITIKDLKNMKYTHGQKVTCEIKAEKIKDAKISIDKDGTPFICQNIKCGVEAEDKLGYEYSWKLDDDFTQVSVENLKPLKSFENPEVGDIYYNKNFKKTVLGVAGRVIFMSGINQDKYSAGFTKEELIKLGYKVEEKEVEVEEVEEITMEELIKELGREVIIKK